MRATVREYTVKKKVVVVEFTEEEALRVISEDRTLYEAVKNLREAIAATLEADHAEEQRKESEDVPF